MTALPPDRTVYYRRSRFTTHLPVDRLYSPAHYWLLEETPGVWRIGFTRFATRMLGDIVEFNFATASGAIVEVGDEVGTVEGLKAISSVFSVGSGRFLGDSPALRQDVTLVESDCYGEGWLYKLSGQPASDAVDVQGYVAILDATVDKMLASRYTATDPSEDPQ